MNRIVLAIAAAALLAGGLLTWYLARPAGEEPTTTEAEFSGIPAGEAPPATGQAETLPAPEVRPNAMPPAKRIRHGTAAGRGPDNPEFDLPPSGNEKIDRLARQVEKALAGSVGELIGIARLIDRCNRPGMGSEEHLQQRLDRMAQFQSRNPGGPVMPSRGMGGSVEYQSFEEMETDLWAQFDECQVSSQVLDETLYEQVKGLAESGVPSARYLYSVWPPDQDSFALVDTLELLEYQNLALEYTWANMQERNPLGLLAMSQSYTARRPSMFTPNNGIQGQVFLLASMKCGIDNDWLENRALNFGQGVGRFEAENMEMPSLEEDAATLADMFCPVETEE